MTVSARSSLVGWTTWLAQLSNIYGMYNFFSSVINTTAHHLGRYSLHLLLLKSSMVSALSPQKLNRYEFEYFCRYETLYSVRFKNNFRSTKGWIKTLFAKLNARMCKCAQLQIVGKVKFAHIDKYACIGKYERHNLFSSVPSYDAARCLRYV